MKIDLKICFLKNEQKTLLQSGWNGLINSVQQLGSQRLTVRHVEREVGREGGGGVEVLLRRVHVRPDEDLVVDPALQGPVDEVCVGRKEIGSQRVRSRAGHLRYFLMFSIINNVFSIFYQV